MTAARSTKKTTDKTKKNTAAASRANANGASAGGNGSETPARRRQTATVQITLPDGRKPRVRRGTRASDVLKTAEIASPHPVVAVRYRNKVTALERPLEKSGTLAPIHLGTRDGALIARRSLTFVLVCAVAELFPAMRVYINHSMDYGYYAELYCDDYRKGEPVALSQSDIDAIEKRMRDIIDADEPIERDVQPLEKALKTFEKAGMHDKVALLRFLNPKTVSVYKLRGQVNQFYGQLAPSTGVLKTFELEPVEPGFVMRFPRTANPDELPPRQNITKLAGVMREYEQWMKILQWRTVAQLNDLVETDSVREYVLIAEALHEKRLSNIADTITNHPRKPRIVLLAGPSSSGKTTTIKKLSIQLRVNGREPLVVELDNFFVDRERTPRDEFGELDFESFHAIDVQRLQDTVRGLLSGRKVKTPKFDFKSGRSIDGPEMQLPKDGILILEGIHGLNDQLLPAIPDGLKFKIYASPLTHLNIDDHNRISSADARLIRRIVRDFNYRGHDAVDTLMRWPSVRRGEERNIFPYQHSADVVFNSSLPYELAAMKQYAIPVLKRVKRTHPEYAEAARLIKFLGYFRDIRPDYVPRHSLLREFMGGGCFTY